MTVTHRSVLVRVVDLYRQAGSPQSSADIAVALDAPPGRVSTVLASLETYELVVDTGDGYRPTVTGQELLALDAFDDGNLIIDLREE